MRSTMLLFGRTRHTYFAIYLVFFCEYPFSKYQMDGIPKGTSMRVVIYQKSTIYISHHDAHDGGFEAGWIRQDGQIDTTFYGYNRILKRIWKKLYCVTGPTHIRLPILTSPSRPIDQVSQIFFWDNIRFR